MGFTIPNDADAAFGPNSPLASPDSRDFDILVAGISGNNGVLSGCAVTAQGSPNMTVAVAAGVVVIDQGQVNVTAANATITTAHATLIRLDLVTINSSGTIVVVPGTASATPVIPTLPATSAVLALVYVEPADTTISSTQIIDKRVTVIVTPTIGYGMSLGY